MNALTASHGVIIPLECEFFALRGVAMLIETIDKVRDRLNPSIELDGVLATMYDARTLALARSARTRCRGVRRRRAGAVIGRTVKFPDASVSGVPITEFAPRTPRRPGLPASRAGSCSPVAPSPDAATDPVAEAGFRVSLAGFDGPFDMLLSLITKRELDLTRSH